ncbi:PTS-dependent dihydroxyacetone kinase phosphotransferase subunit DhaM [Haloferax mediterranei ATCC 33500]|uniref:phosphoenolpyruvate--glycerone phosphotransferase n=1 Tax=Haloferax mediterranei (strain ATCC 33500 / DSM 1411 / JCM 8866 / NBRC 14739 / NCIMB 2177 / R-4) TaxID=523841 RepID=I3R501_HALMT|nr:dihydroxyacetone kinase phosphoryl donor subunit DhaM [Haloferax mediterranei]AFK19311.1 phosphoenolpyruvate-protein phosphoryltransferase [Haloferax mediterranei ATCC 33500]AHZ21332.1 PTS mannose transporter subunit IID [Haloferax mediterranei ATCC 33500]EMA04500.1 phosphoenolpyruvate-protein phosphoryltransferase [Haloferax mediterranei ATCC 33500]MDX5989415.1 dihydroxyacetone kinase phosphoryl donor subunit DhaM [Haloferax mediterranei ATCC 33500]QCQ75779.1 PTS-dependent dihydroxyacetone
MIGLVVVSHSAKAAEGIADVAEQMGGGNARIVPAGGDEDGIGTSPDRIREGIEEADDGDGVVVLVDLGSAVMNAELAIEMAMDVDAIIADAPILEGTLNAAVETTSPKATLDSVVERATDARDYRKLN